MDDQQLLRYNRQIMLPSLDIEGQEALLKAHIIIVGLGGLGSPAAMYLASAGVGCLSLVDFDTVDLSNLQRQIIHHSRDIGELKVNSAKHTLHELNDTIEVRCYPEKMQADELEKHLHDVDVILDCSDNFATRYALNALACKHVIPLVSGAAIALEGQVSVFDFRQKNSPCYACLYPDNAQEDPASCAENGVLGPVVGVIGSMQALEAIKLVSGIGNSLHSRLLQFNGLTGEWRSMHLKQDSHCPVCSETATE